MAAAGGGGLLYRGAPRVPTYDRSVPIFVLDVSFVVSTLRALALPGEMRIFRSQVDKREVACHIMRLVRRAEEAQGLSDSRCRDFRDS